MIKKLKVKLQLEGRTYKWFISAYLSGYSYNQIMSQINEFVPLKEETEFAIKKYLSE